MELCSELCSLHISDNITNATKAIIQYNFNIYFSGLTWSADAPKALNKAL